MSSEGKLYQKMTFLQDGKDKDGLKKQKKAFKFLSEAAKEFHVVRYSQNTSAEKSRLLAELVIKWFGEAEKP